MLFTPLHVGATALPNRILLAPLTRTRAAAGQLPNDLMTEYYSQRASGGLLITECTMVAPGTSAFINEPGIYNAAQITAWKKVTTAVHAKGGRIFRRCPNAFATTCRATRVHLMPRCAFSCAWCSRVWSRLAPVRQRLTWPTCTWARSRSFTGLVPV